MLSKIESFLRITLITAIEITAAGIEADTVIPTLSPRYAFAAPNTTARITPIMMDAAVNSGVTLSAGIYGLNSLFSILTSKIYDKPINFIISKVLYAKRISPQIFTSIFR